DAASCRRSQSRAAEPDAGSSRSRDKGGRCCRYWVESPAPPARSETGRGSSGHQTKEKRSGPYEPKRSLENYCSGHAGRRIDVHAAAIAIKANLAVDQRIDG